MDEGSNRMSLYEEVRRKIFGNHNPYAGFPAAQWAGTWYHDHGARLDIFKKAIDKAKPGIIVEVGSFVGESAIFMADYLKTINRESVIVCIDTWCGGIDHWEKVPEKLKFWFGRPSLFYQFMGNVIVMGAQDRILPISMDSLNGARLLNLLHIVPQMVYVDGSHEEGDVLRDYEAFWRLLPSGGVMLVDDLTGWFPTVLHDWDWFIKAHQLIPIVDNENGKGMLVKP